MDDLVRLASQASATPDATMRSLIEGPWVELVDPAGNQLNGIRGRQGAAGLLVDGAVMGSDLIEMEPGRAFARHSHPGAHILYILDGEGAIEIDGLTYAIRAGDSVFVAAELAHGVTCDLGSSAALRFLAVGYPHRELASPDRMRIQPRNES